MARCAVRALKARHSALNASDGFRPLNAGGDTAARRPAGGDMCAKFHWEKLSVEG